MKQLFSKLTELVTKDINPSTKQHREFVPVRIAAHSSLEPRARRAARYRSTGQGWRVTSFSGF